jgi:apolipoprotein N-acyltransferase
MADQSHVPLVVDLDGTLIRTDLMWESLARMLCRNPFSIFLILFWWSRGRAYLKQQLVARIQVPSAELPYNERFVEWLRKEKNTGRPIILATASDLGMAQPVANHLGLFELVMASDGKTNLRRDNKRKALVAKFGDRGFDYAGNSKDDLMVWPAARQAIVVNAPPAVRAAAAQCTAVGPSFCEDYRPFEVGRRFVTELFWRSGFLLATVAGILLDLSFPKFSVAGFAWIVPALMLGAAYGKSGAAAFRVGYVAGLTFWLASLYWLLLMPATGFPILAWLALPIYIAVYFGAWTWFMTRQAFPEDRWSGRVIWSLGGAAAWVALEMIRARLFGGFPWSFLGASQYQLIPLIQIASVTGVYGVSFLVTWFSLAVYSAAVMMIRHPTRRQAWQVEMVLPMFIVIAVYVGGYIVTLTGSAPQSTFPVTAIQPSVPQTLIWSAQDDARRFSDLLSRSQAALTAPVKPGGLLVWPESAVPELDEPTYESINAFARSNRVWIVLNGDDVEVTPKATNYFNAAFLVGPDGKWRQAYHKRELVIFGEYVPLETWLPFIKWLTPISGGWTPGDKPVSFILNRSETVPPSGTISITQGQDATISDTVECAPLICFEDSFPTAGRDSAADDDDFLVNLTNDGWFGQSSEQWQHLANSVFRAVENGLPLFRSANNGITCLVDKHGRITELFRDARHSEYGPGTFTADVPLRTPREKAAPTFYHRHGDWFGWGCVGIAAFYLIRSRFAAREARHQISRPL